MPFSQFISQLRVSQISPNPQQPRKFFSERSLKELSQSIKTQGVIQPLVVREIAPESYELIAGERRWRALQYAGIEEVPVVVRVVSEQDLLEVALLENIQREALTPIEEANAYQKLLDSCGYTHEVLAHRIGKSRSAITNLIRLLNLPDALQQDLETGRMSMGHARALLALNNSEQQLKFRDTLLRQQWSVRKTETQVRTFLKTSHSSSTPTCSTHEETLAQQITELEQSLSQHLGTRISVQYPKNQKKKNQRKHSGNITIHYTTLDEFDRIYEILTQAQTLKS